MKEQADPLWDPKYAVLGVIAIAVGALLIDVLPVMIRRRLKKLGEPQQENEPWLPSA